MKCVRALKNETIKIKFLRADLAVFGGFFNADHRLKTIINA